MKKFKQYSIIFLSAIICIIWIFPFYIMIVNSLKPKKEVLFNALSLPNNITFSNYIEAIKALNIEVTIYNSTVITFFSVIVILIFGSMAAYALNRTKTRISRILYYIFVAAMLIPFQSIMFPLVSLLSIMGLLLSRTGIIFVYLGTGVSLSMFLVHSALNSIPLELDDASRIDGCNPLQSYIFVMMPMLRSILSTIAVLNSIWIWNDYLLPSMTINQDSLHTIPIRIYYFFGQYTKQWHLALATLTISVIPIIIFYFVAQTQIIKGITDGAIK